MSDWSYQGSCRLFPRKPEVWNEFVVSDWRRAVEGRGRRGLLGLKSTERFERTFLAASSCKPFPITKFPIRPFSVQFLTLITVEPCYWHPVVPVFRRQKRMRDRELGKKKRMILRKSWGNHVITSSPAWSPVHNQTPRSLLVWGSWDGISVKIWR